MIHEEWIRSVVRRRPEVEQDQIHRKLLKTATVMNLAIPDSLVEGYESLIEGIHLPDADDRHVVAAAIRSNAEVIVTFNLKDFPDEALKPFSIQAQHPDEFVISLIDINENAVWEAARKQRANLRNPTKSVEELLCGLEKSGLVKTVEFLRRRRDFI